MEALNDTVNHVKTELMPDFDYDSERTYKSENSEQTEHTESSEPTAEIPKTTDSSTDFTTQSKISDDEEMNWN
jgi:hypothetical protein